MGSSGLVGSVGLVGAVGEVPDQALAEVAAMAMMTTEMKVDQKSENINNDNCKCIKDDNKKIDKESHCGNSDSNES